MTLLHISKNEYYTKYKIIELVKTLVEYDDKDDSEAFTKTMAEIRAALIDLDIEESR